MTTLDSMQALMASSASPSNRDRTIRVRGRRNTDTQWADGPTSLRRGIASPPADLEYEVEEGILRIRIDGPLDLRCAFALLLIGQTVDDSIDACTLDLTGVDQVFDSGIAALVLVAKELTRKGVGRIRIQGLDLESPTLQPFLM
jgi:ABC-type transporter Mla MlaB component